MKKESFQQKFWTIACNADFKTTQRLKKIKTAVIAFTVHPAVGHF